VIPPFRRITGDLPPGVHIATWAEFVLRYGYNKRRRYLLDGLERAMQDLQAAGCRRIYIDGSFINDVPLPGDFDCYWERAGVNEDLLPPELVDLDVPRTGQKERYNGEIFPADLPADLEGTPYIDFFQRDDRRPKRRRKGIIAVDL